MGFYGNITNTSKTTFVFDKIYPNRYTMENKMGSDGVYMGRYVLIEYDEGVSQEDYYKTFYRNPADNWFYGSPTFELATKVLILNSVSEAHEGSTELLAFPGDIIREKQSESIYTSKYYIVKDNAFQFAIDTDSNYVRNFNIDRIVYGESRGWDSTVWIKEFVNQEEKYVQIAELNTVIPTFGVTADAPTQTPITPHFDQNSTNIYYKLHMQPQWGVRVAASQGHSDTDTVRETVDYDPANGETHKETTTIPANIFYNNAGFNVNNQSSRVNVPDKITFLPTGSSGTLYNKHDGSGGTETAEDIYELSLVLPSLGNTISTIWDIIYGTSRNQSIAWGAKTGLRLTRLNEQGNYQPSDAQTIAGCINSVQDLLGTIVLTALKPEAELTEEDTKFIYHDGTLYKRAHLVYKNSDTAVDQTTYDTNKSQDYFHNDGSIWNPNLAFVAGSIFTRSAKYEYIELEEFATQMNTLHGMLLKINKMLEYATPETRDRETVQGTINTLNDLINKIDNLVPGEFLIVDSEGKIHSAPYSDDEWINIDTDPTAAMPSITITHEYNPQEPPVPTTEDLNSVENADKDTITIVSPVHDETGHIVANSSHTITLPYSFKNVSAVNNETAIAPKISTIEVLDATKTKDLLSIAASNKWVKLDTDKETNILSIGHELTPATPNVEFGLGVDLSIDDLDADNTFEVPCFTLDEAGHIINAETHTVTIPELFTQVAVVGTSNLDDDSAGASGTISADTLKDILSLNAANKWIQLKPVADSVEFRHYVKVFAETNNVTDLDSASTFTVQELTWDKAGHLTGSVKRTYTLPDGIKTVTIGAASTSTEVGSATGGNLVATTQNDTISITPQNKWITMSAGEKTVAIGHAAASTASTTKGQDQNKTLTFGDNFKTLHAGIDQTGHVSVLSDYTITLPSPSLSNGTGNIVTGLTLTPSSGAFVETKTNVGTLALAEYVLGTDSGAIANTDTINTAFSKLQKNVNTLNGDSATVGSVAYQVAQVVAGASTSYDTLKEIADWILSDTTGAAKMASDISDLETKVGTLPVATQISDAFTSANLSQYLTTTNAATTYQTKLVQASTEVNDLVSTAQYNASTVGAILTDLLSRVAALEST